MIMQYHKRAINFNILHRTKSAFLKKGEEREKEGGKGRIKKEKGERKSMKRKKKEKGKEKEGKKSYLSV